MVKLRLARVGRKKVPFYHLVVTDSKSARDTSFIEKMGTYNPLAAGSGEVKFDVAKINGWLDKGAQPSDRLQKLFLANQEIGNDKQRKTWETSLGVSRKGVQAKIAAEKAKADKIAAAEAAKAKAEADAKAAAEAAKAAEAAEAAKVAEAAAAASAPAAAAEVPVV